MAKYFFTDREARILMKAFWHRRLPIAAYSCEHIVPRSLNKVGCDNDLFNLVMIPRAMNAHRSNYECVESLRGACIRISPGDVMQKDTKKKTVVIPVRYRGWYARACGYMALTYPTLSGVIHTRVMSPTLIDRWATIEPVCPAESAWNEFVRHTQGNHNPFISAR